MKPERESCLVEVLDRLLNKGAVLNADLIISVAGMPMIGLNLRAVLASMETMLDYGIMEAWDKSTREWYALHESRLQLDAAEDVLFKAFGYLWNDQGVAGCWLPGIWHITSMRVLLWKRFPGEIVFEVPLQDIILLNETLSERGIELDLTCSDGSARIYLSERKEFMDVLKKALVSTREIEAVPR